MYVEMAIALQRSNARRRSQMAERRMAAETALEQQRQEALRREREEIAQF